MKISNSAKNVVGVSLAVALLAGCTGNGGSQLAPSGPPMGNNYQVMGADHKVNPMDLLVTPRDVNPSLHKVPRIREMQPNCCALQKTVFITDAFGGSNLTGAVYAFDYVTGASLGTLPAPPEGFAEVQGVCSDTSGNVYVTNTEHLTVDEYSHSGAYIATINDEGYYYPVSCAFDRTTGNLAIGNMSDTSGGSGSISIAAGGVIKKVYYPPNMAKVYFLGYEDGTSRLWLDGVDNSGLFQYDRFESGVFTPVAISGGTIGFPGTVAWSAKTKTMNVGDQDTFTSPTLYQVDDAGAIRGSTVTVCGQQSDMCDPVQWAIKGSGAVLPDAIWLEVNRVDYPLGSQEVNYPASYVQPIGAAVSPNKP